MGQLRITDRDRQLLEFASLHRLVLADHAAALLQTSREAAAARMRALARAGLLGQRAAFDRQPRCFWVTRKGLDAVGSRLQPTRLDLREYRHDVGVAWLWLAARSGAFGPLRRIVSEREMRSRDALRPVELWAVRLGGVGPAGRERLHYPDLLLIGCGARRVAVELELTAKTRTRRERILAAYGADKRIDGVVYVVDRAGIGRSVRASAARLGISPLIRIQPVRRQRSGQASGTRVVERVPELGR
jgi:hypothetical protein